jgi:transcriptional regulator with XRE-family HTH domain
VTDARYTYTAGMPAVRVGWLVARARAVAGIADRDLASSLGLPVRTIRRWERGDVVPTDDEVEAIAAACGTRLTELLPRRASVSYDPSTGIMRMGDQAVALPGNMLDNDTVLGAFIGMVRRQRGLRPDQDVKVRQEDLEALGEALDLDDDELEERLVRVIGMSRTQAAAVRAQLLRRRLAVPMVGMLAALSLLGVNRIFTTATEQVKTVAGGAIIRGNPFAAPPTTATTVLQSVTIKSPDTTATTAPAPTAAPTLPPVVTEDTLLGPPQPTRTGPPHTKPRETATDETDAPASDPAPPVTAAPTTPPATPAPTTPPPATSPPETPPPTAVPIGTPVVQETTTVPPASSTTTTTVPPTTTSTIPPVATTITNETTTLPPDPPVTSPLSPVETTPGAA